MGTRSRKAPLNPNEELTLRRIALGIAAFSELPGRDVERLRHFGLVDAANRLTPEGQERYQQLSRPAGHSRFPEQRLAALLSAVPRAKP